jgi:hypothetical protein
MFSHESHLEFKEAPSNSGRSGPESDTCHSHVTHHAASSQSICALFDPSLAVQHITVISLSLSIITTIPLNFHCLFNMPVLPLISTLVLVILLLHPLEHLFHHLIINFILTTPKIQSSSQIKVFISKKKTFFWVFSFQSMTYKHPLKCG